MTHRAPLAPAEPDGTTPVVTPRATRSSTDRAAPHPGVDRRGTVPAATLHPEFESRDRDSHKPEARLPRSVSPVSDHSPVTPPSVLLAAVATAVLLAVTPPSGRSGFGAGPTGESAVAALAVLLFAFAVVAVVAARVGLAAPLVVVPLTGGLWVVDDSPSLVPFALGFAVACALGAGEATVRGRLGDCVTPAGRVAAGVHVTLAVVLQSLVRGVGGRTLRELFVVSAGVCVVLAAGAAAAAVTLATDHDVYAPALVVAGWAVAGLRGTLARVGDPRLRGFEGLSFFQTAPTPDYLFQVTGLVVVTVAVAAVEWDLRRVVGVDQAEFG